MCPDVNDTQVSRRWVKMDSWGSDWLDFQEPASPETVEMTGKSELQSPHTHWSPCHSLTMNVPWPACNICTAHRIVLLGVEEDIQPCLRSASLINCEFLESVLVSVCVHVCMHTCTHCHVPVMDFILIGYDIVQGLVGLLGTRVSVFPISLIKGNSFIQPPWSSLCSKWEIQAAVN